MAQLPLTLQHGKIMWNVCKFCSLLPMLVHVTAKNPTQK